MIYFNKGSRIWKGCQLGKNPNTGTLLLILAVAVLGGGAGWYFKIYRPKHEKAAVPEEDYSEELADYDDSEDDGPPWDEDDTESEDNE